MFVFEAYSNINWVYKSYHTRHKTKASTTEPGTNKWLLDFIYQFVIILFFWARGIFSSMPNSDEVDVEWNNIDTMTRGSDSKKVNSKFG